MSVLCDRVRAMKRSLREIAEAVGARLQGDGSLQVRGVASISAASHDDLVFVEEEKYFSRALQSKAGAVIAGEFAAGSTDKPLLISSHPKLIFARAARFLQDEGHDGQTGAIHATAIINPSARIAQGAAVGERAVISADAEIGKSTRIGASWCHWARSQDRARVQHFSERHDLFRHDAGRPGDRACRRGSGERWLRICA